MKFHQDKLFIVDHQHLHRKMKLLAAISHKIIMDGDYLFDWLKSISLIHFLGVMNVMNILLASLSVFPAASHAKWCSRKF